MVKVSNNGKLCTRKATIKKIVHYYVPLKLLKVSLKLLSEAAAHRFSVKGAVLKIFSKFKRKHLCRRFFNEFEQNTNED